MSEGSFSRRELLAGLAGLGTAGASTRAFAEPYPERPVRLVVGFATAGPQDIFARLIAQALSERLGQQFVVENKTGAGGNIAAEDVINAAADGYTLLLVGPPNAINATLYEKLNFDFLRDIAPVGGIARTANVMLVRPNFPAQSIPEFIAYAKANPGKINMASGGNGTVPHVAGELFNMLAGVHMVHVPYRGEALGIPDLLAGQIQVEFGSMAWAIEYIKDGRLRALGVTTAARSELLPDVPAIGEVVPGYEASAWYGIGAPRNTPERVIGGLNAAINACLATPDMRGHIAKLGGTALSLAPAAFGALLAEETQKWGKVIRTAGIKAG